MSENAFDVFESGGDSVGYLNWSAQERSFQIGKQNCELKKFLIDPSSLKTGWGLISSEGGNFVWADVAGTSVTKPAPYGDQEYKPAIELQCYVSQKYGAPIDGWVEGRTNARGARDGLHAIWEEIHDQSKDHLDESVVIELAGMETVKFKKGGTVVPQFKILGWGAPPEPRPSNSSVVQEEEQDEIF